MTWDYRVMKRTFKKEIQFAIYEVYYNENDKVELFSEEPMYIYGETLKELKRDLKYYKDAFKKPVLNYNKLEKRIKKGEKK